MEPPGSYHPGREWRKRDPHRHARQPAGALAGAARCATRSCGGARLRRRCVRDHADPHVAATASRTGRCARRAARGCSPRRSRRRCSPARSTSPCIRPRTWRRSCRPGLDDRRLPRARGSARRADRARRRGSRRAAARRAHRHGLAPPRGAHPPRAAGRRRSRSCAATCRRGWSASRRAISTRRCSPRPACGGSGLESAHDRAICRSMLFRRPAGKGRWRSSAGPTTTRIARAARGDRSSRRPALAVACERAFLAALDGSCRTPIAGYARVDGDRLRFDGIVLSPDGREAYEARGSGSATMPPRSARRRGEDIRRRAPEELPRCRRHRLMRLIVTRPEPDASRTAQALPRSATSRSCRRCSTSWLTRPPRCRSATSRPCW